MAQAIQSATFFAKSVSHKLILGLLQTPSTNLVIDLTAQWRFKLKHCDGINFDSYQYIIRPTF